MGVSIAKSVLTIVGFAELTAANIKLFRKKVSAALNGHTVVEIDLSQTTFMDCAGVAALVGIRNLIRGGTGVVRLMNPTSPVQQMLDLLRAGLILEIVNTRPADFPRFASHRLFTFEFTHLFGLPLPGASWRRSHLITKGTAREEKCPPQFTRGGGASTDRQRPAQQTRRRRAGRELQNGGRTSPEAYEEAQPSRRCRSSPLAEEIIASSGVTIA